MKSRTNIRFGIFLVFSLSLIIACAAAQTFAWAYQLSGTVTDRDSVAIADVKLSVVEPDTGTTVGTATSNAAGAYALSVDQGTYNLVVKPPNTSGFGSTTVEGITLTRDTIQNIILVPVGARLTGRLLDRNGNGVKNFYIKLVNPCDSVLTSPNDAIGWDISDCDGAYSIAVPEGTYDIIIRGQYGSYIYNKQCPPYAYYRVKEDLNIQADLSYDIYLPIVYLSGTVFDAAGDPVSGVRIDNNYVYKYEYRSGKFSYNYYIYQGYVITDSEGRFDFPLLAATYDIIVTPPADSGYKKQFINKLELTADTTLDITLELAPVISGRVLDKNGKGVRNFYVKVVNPCDSVYINPNDAIGWDISDCNGAYSIAVPEGTYDIIVRGRYGSYIYNKQCPPYAYYRMEEDLDIQEDLTHDIYLPIVYFSGIVVNEIGEPVSGVRIDNDYMYKYKCRYGKYSLDYYICYGYVITDSEGRFEFPLLAATYDFIVTPPADSLYRKQFINKLELTADTTRNITLEFAPVISGRVLDRDGNGVKNFYVKVVNPCDSVHINPNDAIGWDISDCDGAYSIAVPEGTYDIIIRGMYGSYIYNKQCPPYVYYRMEKDLNIQGNLTYDIHLPLFCFSGIVVDAAGEPVSGVRIDNDYVYKYEYRAGKFSYNYYIYQGYVITDSEGKFSFPLLEATYDFSVTPPAESRYAKIFLEDFVLDQDISELVILEDEKVNLPPTASAEASPVSGASPLAVEFTGTGTDDDGVIVNYEWDFDGDGTYDWSDASSGDTTYTYSAAGTYNAVLRVTDDGNSTGTDTVAIEVLDTTPPTIAITSPADGTKTISGSIIVSGTVSDNVGIAQVTVNGKSATVSGDTFTIDGVALNDGENTILAQATDEAGNSSSASITVIKVTASGDFIRIIPTDGGEHGPGTAYAVSVLSKAVGLLTWSDTFSNELEMGADGTIGQSEDPYVGRSWSDQTGSITYNLSGLDFSEISDTIDYIKLQFDSHENLTPCGSGTLVLKNGATIISTINCTEGFGPWSFIIPFDDFNATSKVFTVEMTLSPVHYGQWHSHGVSINLNVTPPTAKATADPTSGIAPLVVTFTGTGTDTDGTIAKYEWDFDGNGTYDWSSASSGNTTYTYPEAGIYNASLRVTDNDSLTDIDTITITVTKDATPPLIKITQPADGSTVSEAEIEVTGTVDDPEAAVKVNGLNASVSEGIFSKEITLSLGDNTITATATDPLGNKSSDYITVSYAIEPTEPVIDVSPLILSPLTLAPEEEETKTLTVKNIGTVKLTFDITLADNAQWLSLDPVDDSLLPGEATTVTLTYSAPVELGEYKEFICINSNDEDSTPIAIEVKLYVQKEDGQKWYLAEGCTSGFDTWVLVMNPNDTDAECKVTFMKTEGDPLEHNLTVPATGRYTVHVNEYVPNASVSTMVESTTGLEVIVERSMYWSSGNVPWAGGHCTMGVTESSPTWYLAEGCTSGKFDTWVLVMNPNNLDAECLVTFMLSDGSTVTGNILVPATSRYTICVKEYVEADSVSTKIESTNGVHIIAERAIYWNAGGAHWEGGHCNVGVTGPATSWHLAEGDSTGSFDTWILIMNPSDTDAECLLTFMNENGETVQCTFSVPATGRYTVHANDYIDNDKFATKVESVNGTKVIVERAVYWDANGVPWAGGHCSMGVAETATTWYMAEGCTSGHFQTWVLIMNPFADSADCKITFMKADGENVTENITVPAISRYSVYVNDYVDKESVSTKVESKNGIGIMAERSMYWKKGNKDDYGETEKSGKKEDNFLDGHCSRGWAK